MLLKQIKIEDIQIGLKVADWEEAIRKSALPLLRRGAIEASYIDAMVQSLKDNGPYIVLGKHVALAHARPECGANELALSFTTLTPPIHFGSKDFDPIRLIITLAATDAESHMDLIAELADILIDEERMELLFNASDAEKFHRELTE